MVVYVWSLTHISIAKRKYLYKWEYFISKSFRQKWKKSLGDKGAGNYYYFWPRAGFVVYVSSLTHRSDAKPIGSLTEAFSVLCFWVLNSRIFGGIWVLKPRGSTRYILVSLDHNIFLSLCMLFIPVQFVPFRFGSFPAHFVSVTLRSRWFLLHSIPGWHISSTPFRNVQFWSFTIACYLSRFTFPFHPITVRFISFKFVSDSHRFS